MIPTLCVQALKKGKTRLSASLRTTYDKQHDPTPSWQALYRALLRSSSAAVRFSRPAAKNTRRYIRDEFAAAIIAARSENGATAGPSTASSGLLARQTQKTLALHLSASLKGPSSPAGASESSDAEAATTDGSNDAESGLRKRSLLAHRLISNLSSLTYHHLSPHTQMQSRAHLQMRRAQRKAKPVSSLARVLSSTTSAAADFDDDAVVNALHMRLDFLSPSIKPVRGPISARLREWDGQDPEKITSPGGLAQMEGDLQRIQEMIRQGGEGGEELEKEVNRLKKKIKQGRKYLAQAEAERELKSIPLRCLTEVVEAAQEGEGLLLGKERWSKKVRGEFLPP